MVDVQMGAQHRVDGLARIARGLEVGQETRLQVAPGRDVPFFVVANAGVDDDPPLAGVDHERMDAHDQVPSVVHEVREHPAVAATGVAGRIGKDEA